MRRVANLRRHGYYSKRGYQDVAFLWARKKSNEARACLKVPPVSLSDKAPQTHVSTLEEYLQARQWDFFSVEQDPNELEWATRLVSHVLSAPLTLAHRVPRFESSHEKICIVGARAEATLPVDYWKETLIGATSTKDRLGPPLSLELDFIGPDVVAVDNSVTLKHKESRLKLQWLHTGYMHEMSSPPQWDGYVLYNPGLNHDHLRNGWLPTLELLRETKKPLLLTAHSERDANRDALLLEELFGQTVNYQRNPFASRITYQDPFAKGTDLVSPNMYVALLLQD